MNEDCASLKAGSGILERASSDYKLVILSASRLHIMNDTSEEWSHIWKSAVFDQNITVEHKCKWSLY